MAALDPEGVVRGLWAAIDARDWPAVRALLHDDAVVDWPASAERLPSPDAYVAVNAEYPEGWSIRVLRVLADGDEVASEVEVPMEGAGTFRVASFFTVRDGRIARAVEYWTGVGADEAPAWRARHVEPLRP